MVSLYPEPNFSDPATRNNFTSGPAWKTDRGQYDFRFDHVASSRDSLFVRYSFYRFESLRGAPLEGLARGGVFNDRAADDNKGRHLAVSETHTFSPNVVGEFRFGYKFLRVDKDIDSDVPSSEANALFGLRVPPQDNVFGLPRFLLSGGLGYIGLGGSSFQPNIKNTRTFQILENVSWIRGNHSFKFGADVRFDRSDITGSQHARGIFNFNGKFTGVSFGDFLLGQLNTGLLRTQSLGDLRFQSWMFHAQDDWKVTPNLTLNLGLRYELTSPWFDSQNRMNKIILEPGPDFGRTITAGERGAGWSGRRLVNTDTNNFGPRLGASWKFAERWVLRAGGGVFFGGQQAVGGARRMIVNFPFFSQVLRASTNTAPAFLLADGFPDGFLGDLSSGASRPANVDLVHWSGNMPLPTIYQWNVSLQRQLGRDFGLTAAYVGSSSNYLLGRYNVNASPIGDPATERQRRRFFSGVGEILFLTFYGSANYHGLDLSLERRFARGYSLQLGYTWSHAISNIIEQFVEGDNISPQDIDCYACERGSTSNDVRHRIATGYMIEFPFGQGRQFWSGAGWASTLFGGWELSGVLSAQTGQYFNVFLPNALSNLGSRGPGVWRPHVSGSHELPNPGPDGWFDPSAFSVPRDGAGNPAFGNLGRNSLQEPGIFNWDVGLMKNFQPVERIEVQLRWEVFNVTNTPSYGTPDSNVLSPAAGTIRSTHTAPGQMQFGLRISF